MVDVITIVVSVVLSALVARAVVRVSIRPGARPGGGAPQRVVCDVCGLAYSTHQEARDHARDAHNAPGSDADVHEMLSEVTE